MKKKKLIWVASIAAVILLLYWYSFESYNYSLNVFAHCEFAAQNAMLDLYYKIHDKRIESKWEPQYEKLFHENGSPKSIHGFLHGLGYDDSSHWGEIAGADYSYAARKPFCGYYFSLIAKDKNGIEFKDRKEGPYAIIMFPANYGEDGCRKSIIMDDEGLTLIKFVEDPGPLEKIPSDYKEDGWRYGP